MTVDTPAPTPAYFDVSQHRDKAREILQDVEFTLKSGLWGFSRDTNRKLITRELDELLDSLAEEGAGEVGKIIKVPNHMGINEFFRARAILNESLEQKDVDKSPRASKPIEVINLSHSINTVLGQKELGLSPGKTFHQLPATWPHSSAFQYAVNRTLREEGGSRLSNHKFDPGGKTKYGISQKSYPDLDIESLTEQQAIDIYHREYWLAQKCDEINSKFVASELFDTSVNCGVSAGGKIAQRACNLLYGDEVLEVDGKVGPHTVATLNRLSKRYETHLVTAMNLCQGLHYLSILKSNPDRFKNFFRGWMKRLLPPKELLA